VDTYSRLFSNFLQILIDAAWRVVPHCGDMRNEALDAELKTRVTKQHKKRLREIAVSRHLKVSDILREAIREKIDRETKSAQLEAA
jgi:hypothetical protein